MNTQTENNTTATDAVNIVNEALEIVGQAQAAASVAVNVSKAELGRQVYAEMETALAPGATLSRKAVIETMMNRAGISKKCAQTYYQTIRKSKGLVTAKA